MKSRKLAAIAIALAGAAGGASAQTLVNADVTTNTTWGGAANPSPIILQKPVFVKNGAILTILAGTDVRGVVRTGPVVAGQVAGSPGALIVTQNGRVVANGSSASPIVFTTAAVDNDNDGATDFQLGTDGDPGCDAPEDMDEHGASACDDGVDNDSDGRTDATVLASRDPGCDGEAAALAHAPRFAYRCTSRSCTSGSSGVSSSMRSRVAAASRGRSSRFS